MTVPRKVLSARQQSRRLNAADQSGAKRGNLRRVGSQRAIANRVRCPFESDIEDRSKNEVESECTNFRSQCLAHGLRCLFVSEVPYFSHRRPDGQRRAQPSDSASLLIHSEENRATGGCFTETREEAVNLLGRLDVSSEENESTDFQFK
jgi:hypothetical protein